MSNKPLPDISQGYSYAVQGHLGIELRNDGNNGVYFCIRMAPYFMVVAQGYGETIEQALTNAGLALVATYGGGRIIVNLPQPTNTNYGWMERPES